MVERFFQYDRMVALALSDGNQSRYRARRCIGMDGAAASG